MPLHSDTCKFLARRFRANFPGGRLRAEDTPLAKHLIRPWSFYLERLEPRLLFSGTSSIGLASQSHTVSPAITSGTAPTVVTPAAASPATVTGTTTNLSVAANDAGGAGNLSYDWSVLSKPTGAMTPTFGVNGNNSASNTTATFYAEGNYQFEVTITDSAGLSATSTVSVQVSQTLTSITISPPATMTTSSTQQLTATALDQFGTAIATQPSITWSASSGSFTGSGLYHSSSSAGTPTVNASSGGVSGAAIISVVNSPAILASPSVVTGTSTTLTVVGAGGGLLSSSNWSVTSKPSGATTPKLNVGSSGTSATVTFYQAGTYSFEFQSGALLGLLGSSSETITVTVTQTVTSISVSPSSASLHENGSQQFTATAYDQFGKAMATQPAFSWAVTSGGGNFSATAGNYVAPDAPTTATVAAIDGSVIGSATVTVTNAAPTVATPAQATPNPVTGTSADLTVLGADDGGESNLTYTWSVTSKPAGALSPSFSLNDSNAAKDTVATFSAAGTYELLATITDSGGLSTTSSVSVVVDQTLTSIAVSPAGADVTTGETQQFTATGLDQFGQNMAVQPTFDWSPVTPAGGSVDSTGLYTAPGSTGPDTVTAYSGLVNGSANVTIVDTGTAVASPDPVTGTTATLSVVGGATTGDTYTWSVLSQPGPTAPTFSVNDSTAAYATTATFFAPGDYVFQVADGVDPNQTVDVTVVQTLASIIVTPGTANLNENGQQQFSAVGYDQFGDAMATQPAFAWVVSSGGGAIDDNGLYTAAGSGGAGPATITATSDAVLGNASITVTNAAPTVATPAAATPTPVTGTSTQLSVLGADDGGESNLTYTWNVTGSPPASVIFSTNGNNAAKNVTATFTAGGEYDFLVTIVDAEGARVTSPVTVQVVPTLTSIAVTPADSSLEPAASEQFSATGLDQFGAALATQPVFTWSTLDSIGSIDSNGLYSAPATGTADATIIARGEGLSGSATVALVQPAAAATGPATGSTSGAAASSNSGGNSGIAAILNQPSNSTGDATATLSSYSSGGTYDNVFSDAPIIASAAPSPVDNAPAVAPAPAATPAPAGNSGPANSGTSASAKSAPTASAAPAAVAATKPPMPTAAVPDLRVETVPDQVFAFLTPQSQMLTNLDTVKSEMASQKSLKLAAGSATVLSFGASAAYLIWLLRGGSLLSSLLSILPAWKSMDPLPVLDSFENSRKRKKRRSASDAESLESLVDRSNQSITKVNGMNDENSA